MHSTLIWWTIWGMILGIGLFGLQEARGHSAHLIVAIPLVTGALAAAVLRIKHEYREAVQHAKWVVVSAIVLLLGSGYMYLKAEAYGPFATAGVHKAFLGSSFEMSIPEVQRSLGRKLVPVAAERPASEGFKSWLLGIIPDLEKKSETRILPELVVYSVPGKARFDFVGGKLGRVHVEFEPTTVKEAGRLAGRVHEDFAKEYRKVDVSASSSSRSTLYRKDAVEAVVVQNVLDHYHRQIAVNIQYLPLAPKNAGPLRVKAKAF
jgi:hypothetical protein